MTNPDLASPNPFADFPGMAEPLLHSVEAEALMAEVQTRLIVPLQAAGFDVEDWVPLEVEVQVTAANATRGMSLRVADSLNGAQFDVLLWLSLHLPAKSGMLVVKAEVRQLSPVGNDEKYQPGCDDCEVFYSWTEDEQPLEELGTSFRETMVLLVEQPDWFDGEDFGLFAEQLSGALAP